MWYVVGGDSGPLSQESAPQIVGQGGSWDQRLAQPMLPPARVCWGVSWSEMCSLG